MLRCAPYLTHDHILHSQIAEMEPLFWHSDEKQAAAAAIDHLFSDSFRMFEFKVKRCMRGRSHDWTECPYAHPGEKARRRDPRRFHYSGTACPDYRKGSCKRGDACEYAHGVFESWLHPARYRTQLCKDGRSCVRRVCFFAHTPEQLRILPSSETATIATTATTTAATTSTTTTVTATDFPAVAAVIAPNLPNTTPSHSNDPAAPHPTDASATASPMIAIDSIHSVSPAQLHCMSYDQFPSHPSQEDPLRHKFPSSPHFPFLNTPSSHGHFCPNVLIPSPRSTLQAHSVFSPTPMSPLTSPSTSPPSSPNNFSNPAARRNSFPSSSSSSAIKGSPSASFSQMLCSFEESVCGNMLLDTHPHQIQQQGMPQSSQIHPLDRHNSVLLQSNAGSYTSGEETRHALSEMENLISLLKQVEMAGRQEPKGQAPTQTKVHHGNAAIAIPNAGVIGLQKSKSEPPYLGCYARNLYAAKPTWHSNSVGVGLSWCLTPSDQSEPVVLERVESGRGLRAQIFESLIKSSEITSKEGP